MAMERVEGAGVSLFKWGTSREVEASALEEWRYVAVRALSLAAGGPVPPLSCQRPERQDGR